MSRFIAFLSRDYERSIILVDNNLNNMISELEFLGLPSEIESKSGFVIKLDNIRNGTDLINMVGLLRNKYIYIFIFEIKDVLDIGKIMDEFKNNLRYREYHEVNEEERKEENEKSEEKRE